MRPSELSVLLLVVSTAALVRAAQPSCDGAGIAAAALAPPGGLPSDWVTSLSPRLLFFQVLADFTYEEDLGAASSRKSVGPCLGAWGVKEWERISTTNKLGADVHALVARTDSDIFVAFRGMDSRRDIDFQEVVTSPVFDAKYYGPAAVAFASKQGSAKLADGKANPNAFWTLEGYTDSYESMHAPVRAILGKWKPKMSVGKASGGPRTWFTGHSDGSQLAQLAALKHATDFGADSVGGVLLFGPSRVGSVGFATYFNTLLGDRTVYYAYGRDPASATDFTNAQGLMFPGVGLYACPVKTKAEESLVQVPLLGDRPNVCSELKPVDSFISRLWLPDFVFDTSDPMVDQLSNWEYLAHHIPAITYDGLMRMLQSGQGTAKPDACTLAALGLSQCIVSHKCSTALRPPNADKCRGCASDATCTQYWGMPGARCDNAWPELSGNMCYQWAPGTQLALYWSTNGSPIEPEHAPTLSQLAAMPTSSSRPRANAHRVG